MSKHTNPLADSPPEAPVSAGSSGPSAGSQASQPSGLPPVVVVMVTCNAGTWFREALEALRHQDYPNLAILVVDAASNQDPLPTIAEVLPNGYVRRLGRNPGYAAAANRTLRIVQGASHLVFCHDDVAPEPHAISTMVESAVRENAGIVAPKLVDWHQPQLLQDLGGTLDRTGSYLPAIEPGDLDQGQHDVGSEVMAARGGFLMVRADLFEALGGFDAAMTQYGEEIDFCWRAQVAGARIVTAPRTTVRHLAAGAQGLRAVLSRVSPVSEDDESSAGLSVDHLVLSERHRVRTVLKVRQPSRLPAAVLRLVLLAMFELIIDVIGGRGRQAGAGIAAFTWNAVHWRELHRLRRKAQEMRVVADGEFDARLGSTRTRIGRTIRDVWEDRRARLSQEMHGRELVGVLRNLPLAVWGTVVALWVLGSRHLLGADSPLPAVGQFVPFPASPFDSLRTFSGIEPGSGFGEVAMQSPVHLVVGLSGLMLLGAMGVLQKILVLGMLPLGAWGMSRLASRLKSPRGRLLAVLAYAVVPLPYDSIASGRWDGLVAYAAAPFLLSRVLRTHGSTPYMARHGLLKLSFRRRRVRHDEDEFETLVVSDLSSATASAIFDNRDATDVEITQVETAHDETRRDRVWFLTVRRVFPMALLLGLAASFAPQLLPATVLVALCQLAGSALIGDRQADRLRTLGVTAASAVLGAILVLPAILGSDSGLSVLWAHVSSMAEPMHLETLLQFRPDGFDSNVATFGLLLAALPGVLLGRDWRLHLSLRLWLSTIAFILLTWAGGRGWLGPIAPDPHVFLAIAAATLGLNVGVSVLALQDDLASYRFGWRQMMPIAVFAGVVLAVVPAATRASEGSWELPRIGQETLLSWMDDEQAAGSFRVLWLGSADAMPGGARRLDDDLFVAVAVDRSMPFGPAAVSPGGKAQDRMAEAIERGRVGDTVQLGRLLAPYGIRYLVVPIANGPTASGGHPVPVPEGLETALASQLDLRKVVTDSSLAVYESTAWAPLRHMQSPEGVVASHNGDAYAAQSVQMAGAMPALDEIDKATFEGRLPAGELYVATAASNAWKLTVNGKQMSHRDGFGWANTFGITGAGDAVLRYVAPTWIVMAQLGVTLLWMLLFVTALRHRTRRGRFS